MDKSNVLYEVEERGLIYLIFGDFLMIFVLFITILWLFTLEKMASILCAIVLLIYVIYFLLNSITFKKLIIYENKVVIDRFIFGASIIEISDIKKVFSTGYVTSSQLIFVSQKRGYFSRFCYLVTGLTVIQQHEIETICNRLKQERM